MMFPLLTAGALNSLFFGIYGNTMRALQELRQVQKQKTLQQIVQITSVRSTQQRVKQGVYFCTATGIYPLLGSIIEDGKVCGDGGGGQRGRRNTYLQQIELPLVGSGKQTSHNTFKKIFYLTKTCS